MAAFRPGRAAPALLARWLWLVAALVMAIIAIGGITRLTESGLSITEWRVVTGTLPPLTDAAWQAEFEKYRQIPEYQLINAGMSLAEFKFIYFWEWLHRLWGRLIGAALVLPLVWFAARRMVPAGYGWRLTALAALVGLQGTIGWWMVQSGLVERTDVSHFRLAAHLLTAFFILAGLVWTALDLQRLAAGQGARPAAFGGAGFAVGAVLLVQMLLGAWTAGLNAGQVANSWPLMLGQFVPAGIDWSLGQWFALTHDPFLIHFLHRWWSWIAAATALWLAWRCGPGGLRTALAAVIAVQMLLGITTVLSGVHIVPAVLHQLMGGVLVALTAAGLHRVGSAPAALAHR